MTSPHRGPRAAARTPVSWLTITGVAVAAAALAACSSTKTPHASDGTTPSKVASATQPGNQTSQNASHNPALACAALPTFDAAVLAYPNNDSGPGPTPTQISRWADTASPPLQIVAQNVPAELNVDIATVRNAVTQAAHGKAFDTDNTKLAGALTALDQAAHDNCGFTRLDVISIGSDLTGAPATLPAGPVSVSFTNHAPPNQAGFILLLGRIHDHQPFTLDQIRNHTLDLAAISDIIVAALPGANGTAYATANLTPGHYVISTPVGSPDKVTRILARQIDVN